MQPQLFSFSGNVNVELFFRYFDSYCSIKTSLPVVPRLYESFEFFFIKAKLGFSTFWVKDVEYVIRQNEASIVISLQGGYVNVYREFALDKALFEGAINFMDLCNKHDFEIDKILRKRR